MFAARYFGARYFGERYFGKVAIPGVGYYTGKHYFGSRYFGSRYFGITPDSEPFVATQDVGLALTGTTTLAASTQTLTTFVATQSTGLALTGTMAINATPVVFSDTAFVAGAPLELTLATGTMTFGSVGVTLGYGASTAAGRYFGGRYFGSRYYGRSYWGTGIMFHASVSAGLALTGSQTYAATPAQILIANTSSVISLTGTVGLAASTTTAAGIGLPVGGGRSRDGRRRKRVIVEIDGEQFTVSSEEEVADLVEVAKNAAEETAEAEAASIIEKRKKKARKGQLNTSPIRLTEPQISVKPLDDEPDTEWLHTVNAELAPIYDAYKSVAEKYELALLLNRDVELEEEDALLSVLLTL